MKLLKSLVLVLLACATLVTAGVEGYPDMDAVIIVCDSRCTLVAVFENEFGKTVSVGGVCCISYNDREIILTNKEGVIGLFPKANYGFVGYEQETL